MKNYVYTAFENRGFFKDDKHPERDRPTEQREFESPDELVLFLARKLVLLGDGRIRLRELIRGIATVQDTHDDRLRGRVAAKLLT